MRQLDLFGFPVDTPDLPEKRIEKKPVDITEPVVIEIGTPLSEIPHTEKPTTELALIPITETSEVVEDINEPAPAIFENSPQLLPSSIIFDDGIISVKIKTKAKPPEEISTKSKEKIIKEPQKKGRKSLKEIDAEADLVEIPEDDVLYSKQYYSISQVAKWFRVNNSLIRFWENEFDILRPKKNGKGDRLFRPEDVKNIQLIYQLLRQRKYTIEGAKEYLKTNRKKADVQLQLTQTLQKFKSFLLDLKANLQT